MERKFNQEKALREVAETRVKALKKKIRAYENTPTTTTNPPSTSNGGGSGNNGSINPTNHSNDTSMDAGYFGNGFPTATGGGGTTTGATATTRDDESVGTNHTHDKPHQLPPQSQQQVPPLPYSDQIQ